MLASGDSLATHCTESGAECRRDASLRIGQLTMVDSGDGAGDGGGHGISVHDR